MRLRDRRLVVLAPGILAFVVAGLSVADMFLPRPWDGVVLEADNLDQIVVREVVPDSGADRADISAGDIIKGVDREIPSTTARVQELLNRYSFGDRVPYLVLSGGRIQEIEVELGRRRIGNTSFLVACLLGLTFFVVGTFVVVRQPRLPAAQVFWAMCCLFMLFLVCRLRPASYSLVDSFVLYTGTLALLFLPATFLHFFLIFPRPVWQWRRDPVAKALRWMARYGCHLIPIYVIPALVYVATRLLAHLQGDSVALISGAPAANWWVMVGYMLLGLGAVGISGTQLPEPNQRRGAALVFIGTLLGVVPFIVFAVGFSSFLRTERFLIWGVVPLILVPIFFAYAIIRFQLMNIRVILRRSLLYTLTSALVTAIYAVGIGFFTYLFRGLAVTESIYFPLVFALAIVFLFEPLRRILQGPVDRFFFADRARLQRAMVEMGEAFTVQMDLGPVVRDLVERLPELMGLHFAALYLVRGKYLGREAGPEGLPEELPNLQTVNEFLQRQGGLVRLDQLAPLQLISPEVDRLGRTLHSAGVQVIGLIASPRRSIGVVLLSARIGQITLEQEELRLLRGLLHQASIAMETSALLEERTRQAELNRELNIAASIQTSLLPSKLSTVDGWQMAATCRPAREVGGDFYAELPGIREGERAVVYGDVSGKSISGALMMMAAHEVLNALAIPHPDPEDLFRLANERLYILRGRSSLQGGSFVALGYLGFMPGSGQLRYSLAGQPAPLLRRAPGKVEELDLPTHRVPLGAMMVGEHTVLETELAPGDLLLAYSDGVVEAQSPSGDFFGEERLFEILHECNQGPESAVEEVLGKLDSFTQGHTPYDDLTMVAAQWNGPGQL